MKETAMRSGRAAARLIRQKQPLNKLSSAAWVLLRAVLVTGLCFVILYPLFFKLSISFKARGDMLDPTVLWIPKHVTLDNFRFAASTLRYAETFTNSLVISLLTTVLQIVSCSLAAFGFARLKFKGSGVLFALAVFTIVVPSQTLMIPTYLNYRYFDPAGIIGWFGGGQGLNLLDSYWPFVLQAITGMGIKSGLIIFIFRQFFRGIPKELEEAAYIDGCGVFQTFWRIMLPNAIPAIITGFLFSFVWMWNDNYYAGLLLTKIKVLTTTLPMMWTATQFEDGLYGYMIKNTGELLFIAPIVILYMFVQRYFTESIERTGLVG
ncbi:carbohydrate ABC transporter permease [Paenibacillus methanolicus]|uniref:Multiple sugar transport system permease protein n=1 Tax=Paenibacillus methanolicus TaxID=582686 RepID=A0A5S5CJA1_9BACL|nr:carbohydrate ABC transporter permease [Paenibacillus methanolicus]TYP79820.1 multiple sugar transport system permease protein [Paenibacillus methanolicus]